MYEHELLTDGSDPAEDFRGSIYFSCSLYSNDVFSFINTTYYQPLLSKFSDYRIANESSLGIKAFKNFIFKVTYLFTYDAEPAEDIQNSQHQITTGILYSFN